MICPPCQRAGELNALANQQENNQANFSADMLRQLAQENHAECPGGNWCDCQHVVGRAINPSRLVKENDEG